MEYSIENYYRISGFSKNWLATGNLMLFCTKHECFWLLDTIVSYAPQLKGKDYLKIVTVTLNGQGGCLFKIEDEINGVLVTQQIPYTTLTEDVKVWAIDQEELTICMLPEDY